MGLSRNSAGDDDRMGVENAEHMRPAVLVVDDEEDIRNMLRLTLTRAGYDVREAENGEIALERMQGELPDLILLDVLMPGMDGFTVCRQVRADERTAHIPILMLSARSDAGSRQEGIRAGATQYLTKPQPIDQLIRHVADALNSSPG